MPPLAPNHKAQALLALLEANGPDPDDPLDRSFFHFVKTNAPTTSELLTAIDLWNDLEYRHYVSALLLSNANAEEVASITDISEDSYKTFAYFYFDITVFPHNLAKTRYVKELKCGEAHRQFYVIAIERGASELLEKYRIGRRPPRDPDEILQTTMADMHSRFLTHRGYDITTETAKEALRWGEASVRIARMLSEDAKDTKMRNGAQDALQIALEIRNETKTLADIDVKQDELVSG